MASRATVVVHFMIQCLSAESIEVVHYLSAIENLCSMQFGFKDVQMFFLSPKLNVVLNLVGLHYCISWLGVPMFNVVAFRPSISWKRLIPAKFQKGKCASDGGSWAGGLTAFAYGTSLILVHSPWQILPWQKKMKYSECFTEEPFTRCFVCRFLLLNPFVLPGLSNRRQLRTRDGFDLNCGLTVPSSAQRVSELACSDSLTETSALARPVFDSACTELQRRETAELTSYR
ncbi:hypothetical protein Acr_24g0002370 [Actinidia rufa]|uniref:Uncharacterized protein n=1 Tax=Actinidia rufa TaxID=165716 RepID=A0A7J0GT87_9ERIC|nr:hypothetical protein Acr_24g0002370 [Actinidia rufa]